MALITCPECKNQISETAENCPKCGYKITPEKVAEIKQQSKKFNKGCGIGCLIIIAIIAIGVLINLLSSSDTQKSTNQIVENSQWDGSVSQVKSWLKSNLKDPESLKVEEWGKVVKNSTGFVVRCKYRAKNSFGGFAIEHKVFYLDSLGNITSVNDWK